MVKSSSAIGREHEEFIAAKLDGRRSRSSGAAPQDNVDVVTPIFVIECEATDAQSKSVRREFWQEVQDKVYDNKFPLLALRFRDKWSNKHLDLIVAELNDFIELTGKPLSTIELTAQRRSMGMFDPL